MKPRFAGTVAHIEINGEPLFPTPEQNRLFQRNLQAICERFGYICTDDVRLIVTRTQDEIKRMVIEGKFTPIMKPRFIQRRQQVGFQEI